MTVVTAAKMMHVKIMEKTVLMMMSCLAVYLPRTLPSIGGKVVGVGDAVAVEILLDISKAVKPVGQDE